MQQPNTQTKQLTAAQTTTTTNPKTKRVKIVTYRMFCLESLFSLVKMQIVQVLCEMKRSKEKKYEFC